MRTRLEAPSRARPVALDDSSLKRLVRSSGLIDPVAKKHWLQLLPHLTAADKDRLRQILVADSGITQQR